MVREGRLSNLERLDLLTKAGLIKINENEWKLDDNSILTLTKP